MQWDMVDSFNTSDSFIAGDDDQAIFRWAGADVDSFITQTGKTKSQIFGLLQNQMTIFLIKIIS